VVLHARAAAVIAFDDSDVVLGLVGEDRLEAMPVVVGERQLCAGVRARGARARARRSASSTARDGR
jgi:hypothetical protein